MAECTEFGSLSFLQGRRGNTPTPDSQTSHARTGPRAAALDARLGTTTRLPGSRWGNLAGSKTKLKPAEDEIYKNVPFSAFRSTETRNTLSNPPNRKKTKGRTRDPLQARPLSDRAGRSSGVVLSLFTFTNKC